MAKCVRCCNFRDSSGVESVAWIAERKDVLSGVVFMLRLWRKPTMRTCVRPSIAHYLTTSIFVACGLMSKATFVTSGAFPGARLLAARKMANSMERGAGRMRARQQGYETTRPRKVPWPWCHLDAWSNRAGGCFLGRCFRVHMRAQTATMADARPIAPATADQKRFF